MITTEDLRFIAEISKHKSLACAARTMNVTAPSVTLRLQNIEKKLSMKLIHRPSRVLCLTEEGQILVDKGDSILRDLEALNEHIVQKKGQVSGKLKILAPLGFGSDYIAPLVGEYNVMHPKLEIDLELSDTPNWSIHHKWDIIIYIGSLSDSSLKMITLASNQRFVCASPKYIREMGYPQTPQDLINHKCIALRENNEDVTLWEFTDKTKESCEVVRINPILACNEGRVVKDWAESGLGIIMRSEWDIQPQLESGKLIRLLGNHSLPKADIVALLGSPENERVARISGFITLLKERLALPPWK